MTRAYLGNHAAVLVQRAERENIRRFYCEVLGGEITRGEPDRDFIRLGDNFYIAFMYGEVPDANEFLRSARSIWLELKSADPQQLMEKAVHFGVLKLPIPDPHFYFQAPGGQCFRIVGLDEDLAFYEGTGSGPNVAAVKQAIGDS